MCYRVAVNHSAINVLQSSYKSQHNVLQSSYKSQRNVFTETILGNWRCREDGLRKRTAL